LFNQTITNAMIFSRQFCILYCQVHHCGIFNVIKADMHLGSPHLSWHIWSLHFQHCHSYSIYLQTALGPIPIKRKCHFTPLGQYSLPLNYSLSYHKMYNFQILEETEQKLQNARLRSSSSSPVFVRRRRVVLQDE
jgi:hypothetical protein